MVRSILIAGILAAACVGCIQATPPVSGSPPPVSSPPPVLPMAVPAARLAVRLSPHAPLTQMICTPGDAGSFSQVVQLLAPGYNPNASPGTYTPPVGSPYDWARLAPAISDDLQHAFQNAPPFFQQQLCGLSAIYINASACPKNDPTQCSLTTAGALFRGSWGFRSHAPNATDFGNTYIAISAADLWANGASARPLDDYETQVLESFNGGAGAAAVPSNTYPDASWMSVMAALAHEFGHVLWAETTIPVTNKNYDFDSLITCSAGNFFVGWNYNQHDQKHFDLRPAHRWRQFKDRANEANSYLDHSMPPLLGDLDDPTTGSAALRQLYQSNQPWASLFGAQAPDEDFVETYVMAVLTGYDPSSQTFAGPLTSLPLSIQGD